IFIVFCDPIRWFRAVLVFSLQFSFDRFPRPFDRIFVLLLSVSHHFLPCTTSGCRALAREGNCLIAYYALVSGAVKQPEAPGRFRRNMPDSVVVAVLGAQPAMGLSATRFGRAPIRDAGLRPLNAAEILRIRGGLTHALSEGARVFNQAGRRGRSHRRRLPATDVPQRLSHPRSETTQLPSEIFNICRAQSCSEYPG
ncbi:hypothetical protein KXR50_28325, partial [Sinorhizobium meliloti]